MHFSQHPFIAPTIYASYNGIGAVIVRPLFPEGSLRDVIYKVMMPDVYPSGLHISFHLRLNQQLCS